MLSLLSGALTTFAYAPFSHWYITPLALTVVLRQAERFSDKAHWIGYAFGLGWFGAGISWVHVSIADFGGIPLIGSVAMMTVLCAYLALFPAAALYTAKRLFNPIQWPIALPLIWFLFEWCRSWLLTGFPWLSLGYSQLDGPLQGLIPVVGETGISTLLMVVCACWACYPIDKWRQSSLITAVIFTCALVLNQVQWAKPVRDISVSMVQGNIAQSLRWVPEQDEPTMQAYRALTEGLWNSDIVIWPEAAIPKLELLVDEFLRELDKEAVENNAALITGIINYNFETTEVYNNLITLGAKFDGDQQGHYRYFHGNRYAKNHLLPIGEFVPFESLLRPLAPIFDLPMSSFNRGEYVQPNLIAKGLNVVPAICFEIAFPRQIFANLTPTSDFIVTVSNDAWFGRSHGPAQHLDIARMRAKEFAIPVVRSTNNGISAFVDAKGNITSQLPQFERATLTDTVSVVRGSTPYRILGDLPLWLLVIAFGGYNAALRRKQRIQKYSEQQK